MAATLLFSMFAGLLLLGSPIVVSLGIASMAVYVLNGDDISSLVELAFSSINSFPLMAIPAFIMAGVLMGDAGIARRLIHISEELAGPAAGGLGATAVVACMFFGAISGSGPATTAAVGMLVIPAMIERGYGRSYPAAITATAGGLGVVIAPSIPLVIYGITANVSISALFIAGMIPGVLLGTGLMVVNYITAKRNGYQTEGGKYDRQRLKKCNDPLVSAHLIQLMRGVLGVPHSPETDVVALRCSTGSSARSRFWLGPATRSDAARCTPPSRIGRSAPRVRSVPVYTAS